MHGCEGGWLGRLHTAGASDMCCRPLDPPGSTTGLRHSHTLHQKQHLLFGHLLAPCLHAIPCTAAARSAIGLSGAPAAAYALFLGCHVAAAAIFYVHIARMSWPWAVARVSLS